MKGISKRILAVFLSALMILTVLLPVSAAANADFEYEVVSGTTGVRITGYTGTNADVVIPDIIDGRTVVEISSGAFAAESGIKSVSISSNVLRIMKEAFSGCSALESVSIPASVSSIGDSAFADCVSLKNVNISSASTAIGYYAFEGCTSLESITIPSTKIGYAAFRNCTALDTIQLLDSVQTIGRYAFDSTAWFNSQPAGLKTIGNAVYCYDGDEKTIVIPDGIKCIADYAFYGSSADAIVLPKGLYYIGSFAFSDCANMKYISVPDSVISIGTKAIGYKENISVADFTVYCYDGSVAKQWAENNGLTAALIDSCEHSYSDWNITVNPDCINEGSEMRRCIKCNHGETQVVKANGHSWSGWVTISELSCTTDGVQRRTCTACGETDDDITFATGHTWGESTVIKEPDCVNEGEHSHSCTVCGVSATESIKATGHTWRVDETTDDEGWFITAEPTCDEIGTKSRICSICEATDNMEIIPLGHKANEWDIIKEPTAVTVGEKQGTCTVCGDIFIAYIPIKEEEMPADVTMLSIVEGSSLSFNDSRTCIYGVAPGTTVNEVLLQFEYPGHILVTDTAPTQLTGDMIIGSGCFLFLIKYNEETQENEPIDTACVIIKGDLTGDGAVTAADAREALRASSKLTTLLSPYFLAGDLDGDNNITASEARKILRFASKLDKTL